MMCARIVHRGRYSTVCELLDGAIVKVYEDVDAQVIANEILVGTTDWYGALIITYSVMWHPGSRFAHIIQEKGNPNLGTVTLDDVRDLITSYARMESRGIIHGDICPRNIVRARGRLVPIDFGIISTRSENTMNLQSIKDEACCAHCSGFITSEYNAVNSAIYALGVTICILLQLIPEGLTERATVTVDGEEVTIGPIQSFVIENMQSLCEKFSLLKYMLPRDRVQSFWRLIDCDNRWIYTQCVQERRSCRDAAIMYEGYFRYGASNLNEIVHLSLGRCMTWFDDSNQTLRLLREYHSPGSWYLPCEKCNNIEELTSNITSDSPEIVMYCFGFHTMYYDRIVM